MTFKVAAKAGATVNIYRNGVLVSSVPASIASAIKVTDNPAGENSYQVVIVERNGKISISEKIVVTSVSTNASSKAKVKLKKSAAKTLQSKASTTKNSK